uniref:Uncharacterized protein n=1 Tax=Meloidogyne enterolobii TaxID=390850 RepID=A0A6V7WZI8_MELEN|nr:unnamed protein product [Meloidogyne enterolobii]
MMEVKPLTDLETIVITGKISKFPINVIFLNGAIERHNRSLKKHFSYSLRLIFFIIVGQVVLDFALSQNDIYIESKSKGRNAGNTTKLLPHQLELKEGEAIQLNFHGKMESISFEIETKEDTHANLFISLMPYTATHYVMVEGLEKIKEYNLIDLQRN